VSEQLSIVKELIALAEENNLTELNVEFKGLKVSLRKGTAPGIAMNSPAGMEEERPTKEIPLTAAPKEPSPKALPDKNILEIKTPLTGAFYRAPKPGSPPFVEVGDTVFPGQTLCIVEAMKLMNEISTEVKGRVVKITKENSEVAYEGDVLFHLELIQE
jgi:oxaloacetate decarboxylase (Na+ extruding) subunit alpha